MRKKSLQAIGDELIVLGFDVKSPSSAEDLRDSLLRLVVVAGELSKRVKGE